MSELTHGFNTASYWWLAEICEYGYATKLIDGPHRERGSAEQALTLHKRLGLIEARKLYAIVEVTQYPPTGKHPPVNEEAIATLNAIGLKP